jgi:hypothetical protein
VLGLRGVSAEAATRPPFDVTAYGATGDGSTDDTAAFQAAIHAAVAASGTLLIPAPSVHYRLTSPLIIEPPSGAQCHMHIAAESADYSQIVYTGASAVFRSTGWKRSTVSNVKIRLADSTDGVIGWDIDGDAARPSTSNLTFVGCDVTGVDPANPVGWGLGCRSGDAGIDISFVDWVNCNVGFNNANGGVGFANEGSNSLVHSWFGCQTDNCGAGWSNRHAGHAGNSSMYLYGCAGGYNECDLQFTASEGTFTCLGGRFEHGKRFLDTGGGGGRFSKAVHIAAVTIAAYAPPDGIVVNVEQAAKIFFGEVIAYPGGAVPFGATMFRLHTASGADGGYGTLHLRGCHMACSADPPYTIVAGNWRTKVQGCTRMVSGTDFQTAGFFTER